MGAMRHRGSDTRGMWIGDAATIGILGAVARSPVAKWRQWGTEGAT